MRSCQLRSRDERGVTLILALVFLVAVSMTLVALLDMSTNDMVNTTNLKSQNSLEYAADGATDTAVQWVRNGTLVANDNCGEGTAFCLYLFDGTVQTTPGGSSTTASNPSAPAACTSQASPSMQAQGGGPSMVAYCVNDGDASSSNSAIRGVYFYTCTLAACTVEANGTYYVCTASACTPGSTGGSPILEAHVQFNDYSATSPGALAYGSEMTVLSWVVETANN